MRRFVRIVLPILILAIFFISLYFITIPKIDLPDFEETRSALATLEKYGYTSSQIDSNIKYLQLGFCFLGFLLSVMGYFWLYDFIEKKKIVRVIEYIRKINNKIYNLKLDENSEDELSLLTNELYKTAVLLQKSAEMDKKRAKNMEIALADISHQLRTPLTSLQITLDNIYENPEINLATRQEFLRTASRQVEQMSELVVILLNLAKLDNGTLKMHPEIIEVSKILEDVVDRLGVLAEINNIAINITGDFTAKAKIDSRWQTQAITNIVKNCIEHSKNGQVVDITITSNVVFTRIIVADKGEGISTKDLRHIFERFYKAKNSKADSIGIGLSFAKTLIEADGGEVKVKSKEGVGTKYEITYYNLK